MLVCTITIPLDPQDASPNRRDHWRQSSKIKSHHRWLAQRAWEEAGCPVAYEPVRVRIIVRRARRIDPDNALAGLKSCIDGIFKDALTPDDSSEWVSFYPVEQQTGKRWKYEPEVMVRVEAQ